ncbi:acetylcholine receptor subunit alpha-like [Ylistrum balloti]|uniref:acetylcholine receptor subunit alpha-like n=1 Tax=Ylistrum balloti TaxID=509963 RepID=UPI002905B42F|nr:acetylcholine receptor subunit alpha-like [Ylistrum balloti]
MDIAISSSLFKLMLVLMIVPVEVTCNNSTYKTSLYNTLVHGYESAVRPGKDYMQQTLLLNVSFGMRIIKSFDEVQSKFSIAGHFTISWYDERFTWNPRSYGGIQEMHFYEKDVWIPPLTYSVSYENVDLLGNPNGILSFTNEGISNWEPANIFDTICNADISYYPFDDQTCEIAVFVAGYNSQQIRLQPTSTKIGLRFYVENPVWELLDCQMNSDVNSLMLRFSFQRRSAFTVVNLMIPLLSLCILNIFVFVLPANSGERVELSITILLAIIVFMSIVSESLPNASSPRIAIFCYLLMSDMLISAFIMICTIYSIKLYTKLETENVPDFLSAFIKFALCAKNKVSTVGTDSDELNVSSVTLDGNKKECNKEEGTGNVMTWTNVGHAFDKVCIVAFSSLLIIVHLAFFLVILLK